jgi:hypothetical protein
MPIQIDSIARLLRGRQGRLNDGRALRAGDNRRWANFLATRVRFYFALPLTPHARPRGGLSPCGRFTPVRSLTRQTTRTTLGVMKTVDAVDVTAIAVPAQKEHRPTAILTTLNLPQIVHSRGK